jgi:hypothetical protein
MEYEEQIAMKRTKGDERCPFGSMKRAAVQYFDHAGAVAARKWLAET